jgi:hypothetical protein
LLANGRFFWKETAVSSLLSWQPPRTNLTDNHRSGSDYNPRMPTPTTPLDPVPWWAQFPVLKQEVNGRTAVYFDGPDGAQIPQLVIDAISEALILGISTYSSPFFTSARTWQTGDEIVVTRLAQRPQHLSLAGGGRRTRRHCAVARL